MTSTEGVQGSSGSAFEQYVPWVEKYRPKVLDDIHGHQQNVATLRRQMQLGILPHLLFHGPPGTGKTSTIKAVTNELYGASRNVMVLELNASDDRGLEVVRQNIKTFCQSKQLNFFGRKDTNATQNGDSKKAGGPDFKLVILDECDAMSKDAQNALRRIMEQYVMHTRFCLVCNNLNNVIPALQSRCMRLRFGPLPQEFLIDRIKVICDLENVQYTEGGLKAVVTLGAGDMRCCVNIIQQIAMREEFMIDQDTVHKCCGRPLPIEIQQIFEALLNDSIKHVREQLMELLVQRGCSLTVVIQELLRWIRALQCKKGTAKIYLFEKLAKIEYNLSKLTDEATCIDELVAVFFIARDMIGQDI